MKRGDLASQQHQAAHTAVQHKKLLIFSLFQKSGEPKVMESRDFAVLDKFLESMIMTVKH